MVDAAFSHPCAQSGWCGSIYLGSFWRTGSGQKTTERVVVDRRGGDGGVLRWVPRRVVDGVADSVWVLTVKGGLLGFGGLLGSVDVIRSSCLIGSLWVLRLTGRWAWKGRMARLSTADVDWIWLVLIWI
ncbi:hypothetical protein M0R45_017236 [Rubus argutus]|uniref:Transmembrane protein n=1 Tax=Rubus argutus TaxID=59490 RepID=A0AAW1XVD4_RUBAR